MPARDPELRSLIASKAANVQYARLTPEQRRERTAAARAAYVEQLRDEIDPDRKLPPDELEQRVRSLRRAKMAELAITRHRRAREAAEAAELDELAAVAE